MTLSAYGAYPAKEYRKTLYFSGNAHLPVRYKYLTPAAFAKLTYKYVSLAHCWQKIQHMRLAHLW
ncbi:hypothetical protein D5282_07925 [bacterium 1xD8-48]|nr:hypothetical protein [bacterium 1xD8-48]